MVDIVKPNVVTTYSTERKFTGSYLTTSQFESPYLRRRSLVLSASKLKPTTTMNVFFSGILVNNYTVPCTEVNVSGTFEFIDYTSEKQNDNIDYRTSNYGSYDVFDRGDVITCSTGSAVVVADEIIYDSVSSTNKRILYVANVKGTLSGTLTGSVSNAHATVISVTTPGSLTTNSLGNFYATLVIPRNTFKSGNHKILLTDATTPNPNAATTMCDGGFTCNGVEITHTTHNTYTEQSVTTVTDYTTTTWYTTQYTGGGE